MKMQALRKLIVERTERLEGGWCELSRRSGRDRVALYRAFKGKGQPTLSTLLAVVPCLGLKLSIE